MLRKRSGSSFSLPNMCAPPHVPFSGKPKSVTPPPTPTSSLPRGRRDFVTGAAKLSLLGACLPLDRVRDALAAEPSDEWAVHKGEFGDAFLEEMQVTTESGLMIKDVSQGSGRPAKDGDKATIHTVGYIYESGEKWCNSYKNIPAGAQAQRVGVRDRQKFMKGLSEGLVGMKKGQKRILVIPAPLAFVYTTVLSEDSKSEVVPGGAALVVYVEVLSIQRSV